MILEVLALIVSIGAAGIAIASIVQAIVLRKRTKKESEEWQKLAKKETEEHLSFLTHLVVNSAADPDTVRRMLEDYGRVGEWQVKVSKRPNGKYSLVLDVSASDTAKLSDKSGVHKD
jgi:hypothetical protein